MITAEKLVSLCTLQQHTFQLSSPFRFLFCAIFLIISALHEVDIEMKIGRENIRRKICAFFKFHELDPKALVALEVHIVHVVELQFL